MLSSLINVTAGCKQLQGTRTPARIPQPAWQPPHAQQPPTASLTAQPEPARWQTFFLPSRHWLNRLQVPNEVVRLQSLPSAAQT